MGVLLSMCRQLVTLSVFVRSEVIPCAVGLAGSRALRMPPWPGTATKTFSYFGMSAVGLAGSRVLRMPPPGQAQRQKLPVTLV